MEQEPKVKRAQRNPTKERARNFTRRENGGKTLKHSLMDERFKKMYGAYPTNDHERYQFAIDWKFSHGKDKEIEIEE